MKSRTYGSIQFRGNQWELNCEPHVRMRAKQLFRKLKENENKLCIKETIDACVDLHWFMQRYPLNISQEDWARLQQEVDGYHENIQRLDEMFDGNYVPRSFDMAIPPRPYQSIAAEVVLGTGRLLLADELGLGKTVSAITCMSDKRALPCVVVCPPHLRIQWESEVKKFAPNLNVHVIKRTTPYELPRFNGRGPDVLIISDMGISGWKEILSSYCTFVVFDEVHGLRRNESEKYAAAKRIASAMPFRLGLSGTPIANYGGEMFNVMECISPGVFGSWAEFLREWCPGAATDKPIVKNAAALGSWLKSERLMIRRTRADIGRELPQVMKILQHIDSDASALAKVNYEAGELARIILNQNNKMSSKVEQMTAMGQLSLLLRQATGISKAPYVAAFVQMLVESGERVILAGWHRQVYSIWLEKLKQFKPSMYTGSETDAQKVKEKERFLKGETPILIMSLRSGVGLDGLQAVSNTIVIGELDWTPAVIEQLIGRLHRDGQTKQVTAYYLLSESGFDPDMARILGIKKEQVDGIRDDVQILQKNFDSGAAIRRAAQKYLAGTHGQD
ncbi:DEAD/DEAH box helicase [Planctomicrobium sp. SH668]|uniref:DEAD/DEAH box helicase n=1 Tax=Planctomicrobium sp. SH668 TaxID=3448126 RepID=UPI003F5BBC50